MKINLPSQRKQLKSTLTALNVVSVVGAGLEKLADYWTSFFYFYFFSRTQSAVERVRVKV